MCIRDRLYGGRFFFTVSTQLPLATPEGIEKEGVIAEAEACLLYTSPSPRDRTRSRMPSSA